MITLFRVLLFSLLSVSIFPFLIIGIHSAMSLTEDAKKEMVLKTNSLANECNLKFSEIEKYCYTIKAIAEDIKNDPVTYNLPYNPKEYYLHHPGFFTSVKPEDPKVEGIRWITNETSITKDMTRTLAQAKYLDSIAKGIMAKNPHLTHIYTGYENGVGSFYPYVDPAIFAAGFDMRKRPWYISNLPKNNVERKLLWTLPYWDAAGLGWMITCSLPLYDKDNKFFGVSAIDITIDSIIKNVVNAKLYNTGYAFLIDRGGNLLGAPERAEEDIGKWKSTPSQGALKKGAVFSVTNLSEHPNKAFSSLIKRAIKGEFITEEIKFNELKYIVFSPIKSTEWSVGVVVPKKEILGPIRNAIIIVAIIAIGAVILISFFISRKISAPFKTLSETGKKIIGGNLSARVNISSKIKEFSSVSEIINQMVDSLQNNISELNNAISHFGSILEKASSGDLSIKVNLDLISDKYKPIGEDINRMIEETKEREDDLLKIAEETVMVMENIGNGSYEYRINPSSYELFNVKLVAETINAVVEHLKESDAELKKRESELLKIADETIFVMENIGSGSYEYRINSSSYELSNVKLVAETINSVMEYLKKSDDELRALLKELATPAIEVVKGIIVMPLVGKLTSDRAMDAMEALLKKLASTKGKVGIVDVTGVPTIDSAVADNLIKTLKGVKLIGAIPILTGMSPTTIISLIRLGIEFDFVTKSTLLEGLNYAMKLSI